MKFLLFNLTVAGALVYLFGAEPVTNVVTDGIAAVAGYVGWASDTDPPPARPERPLATISNPVKEPPEQAVPPVAMQPAGPASPAPEPVIEAMPPIADVVEVRTLPVRAVPPPASVESGNRTAAAGVTEAAPKFMSPKERWRELNRLARDMELMFADKVTR
jgi:hypothetical protein